MRIRPFKLLPRYLKVAALVLRICGAVLGGYALSAAAVALMVGLLMQAGLIRSEAVVLSSMLGCVVYLGVLIWAFSIRNVVRLWTVLAVGTACFTVLAWTFQGT